MIELEDIISFMCCLFSAGGFFFALNGWRKSKEVQTEMKEVKQINEDQLTQMKMTMKGRNTHDRK
jgi:uncharacterized protein YneF (UPF0154 family)